MENQRNNKGVIALLIVIIVVLIALCTLFATGTISFKSNNVDTNNPNDNVTDNVDKENANDNNDEENVTDNVEEDNNSNNVKEETNCNTNDNFTINADELSKFGKADYNIIKDVYTGDFSFKLEVNGKINISFENYISNISNAKDIMLFSPPAPYSTLYILTTDGNIYKYETSSYQSKDYKATKIDKYSNITQMIEYQTRKANAGGCDYIILVDKNGKYFELDSRCV